MGVLLGPGRDLIRDGTINSIKLFIGAIGWIEKNSSVFAAIMTIQAAIPIPMHNADALKAVGKLMKPAPRRSPSRCPEMNTHPRIAYVRDFADGLNAHPRIAQVRDLALIPIAPARTDPRALTP